MELTHIDNSGKIAMVDTGDKQPGNRVASASARIRMQEYTVKAIDNNSLKKGDVLTCARIAGIQAGKKTSDLIPLCHPLLTTSIAVEITTDISLPGVIITSTAKTHGSTGVEMEALTAASVAALTVYDMCKAIDKAMVIENIQLETKSGGRSGDWHRDQ